MLHCKAPKFAILAVVCLLTGSTASPAAIVGITSLEGNDSISWSQLGPYFTVLSSPQAVTSAGGLEASVSSAGGTLERLDQGYGVGVLGNFPPGTALLWDQAIGPDITLTFSHPVFAVGVQIMAAYPGGFEAQVYGGNQSDLVTFVHYGCSPGLCSPNQDPSAIFIGLQSDTPDIDQISFEVIDSSGPPNDFMIGTVELQVIPEPTTSAMMLLGFASLGYAGYRRARGEKSPRRHNGLTRDRTDYTRSPVVTSGGVFVWRAPD